MSVKINETVATVLASIAADVAKQKPDVNRWGQPHRWLSTEQRAEQLEAKAAERADREHRRQIRKARSQWRNCTIDFGDGCSETYDKRGRSTGGSIGASDEHDPKLHKGILTPNAVQFGPRS